MFMQSIFQLIAYFKFRKNLLFARTCSNSEQISIFSFLDRNSKSKIYPFAGQYVMPTSFALLIRYTLA